MRPANLGQLQKTLAERVPKSTIGDIRPPIPGLYEAFTGRSLFYSDATGNYIVDGSLIDTRTQKDLTEVRVDERNAIHFDTLPFDEAIKVVKGDGSGKLAVFTDPDCPLLQAARRGNEVGEQRDGVSVHVPPEADTSKRRTARGGDLVFRRPREYLDRAWVLDKQEPADKTCENDPVDATVQLGDKLNVSGTPTIDFEDGAPGRRRNEGADLETKMKEARKG